jgi:V8-like Glu-specific endopeptidase
MKYIILILLLSTTSVIAFEKSICSESDSRVQLPNNPIARLSKQDGDRGCTATLVGENCAITAGHCVSNLFRGEFNVPNSVDGEPVQSQAEDIFFVDPNSIEFQDEGRGNDWAVFKFKKNEKSGVNPGDQFGFYDIETYEPKNSDVLKISGYGTHYDNEQMTYTLLSALGHGDYIGYSYEGRTLLNHKIDTSSGSSGSSVINIKTNKIIGIHGQGGCTSSRIIWNSATLINQHKKLQAAIKKCTSE